MIAVTEEQRKLIVDNVLNAEELFNLNDVNELLFELNDIIIDKGMDENYEINELGVKLQNLYDEIIEQNE